MAILTASNLSQSFGAFDLFSGISLSIPNDGKVGLVGPNGIGKTTLLLILAGLRQASTGSVHRARGKQIGYLPQESEQAFAAEDHTVYEEMLAIFAGLRRDADRLRQMESEMADGNASEGLLEKYGAALEKFELAGGYDYEVRIKQVLDGLGFAAGDWQLPLAHLSGGQKTRVLLARLLLEKPDLLILDEPTNHLDVEAIEWLEGTLRIWEGAILLVSHDRYFLDRVVNVIWEMRPDGIEVYRGNYSAYVHNRQERWALRKKAFEAQKERLEKELDYIRRNIAGQRTQMAKGKLSRISRELDALRRGADMGKGKSWSEVSNSIGGASRHAMSVAEAAAAIKELEKPDGSTAAFKVDLTAETRSGHIILRTSDLEIGYPDKFLFAAEDIELHRLECAALIGPNGSGKTTFLRAILGEIEALSGEIRLGASLQIGYFAQAHEQLNPQNTVIDELMQHHEMLVADARNYLAQFLFRGDDAFKPIYTLSGGERGRLALAILALEGANFLILDEPTNHLDIPAQEMLQDVLERFQGTILIVSHDRYLIDRLASQIWHLEDGRLRVFKGPYEEYVADRDRRLALAKEAAAEQRQASRQQARQQGPSNNALKRQAEQLARIEREIDHLESTLVSLSEQLQAATEEGAFDKIKPLSIEYAAVESQLETHLHQWENMARE